MVEVTVKKAAKLKSTIMVKHLGTWCEVLDVVKWGRNWMVKLDGEYFVVEDTYHGLVKVSGSERSTLLED